MPSTCAACQYPTCHTCAFQHPESENPLRTDSTSRLGQKWYCTNDACQEALRGAQRPQKCDVCLQHKDLQMFKKNKSLHVPSTCAACQYPTCHICAFQHPDSENPIRTDSRSRLGQKWYCTNDACQETLQGAVSKQKDKQSANRPATAKPKAGKREKK